MVRRIPGPERLAALVTRVTGALLGISFRPAGDEEAGGPVDGCRAAALTLDPDQPLIVTLVTDRTGGQALGAAMYCCPIEAVNPAMVDEALFEVLHAAANQIRCALDYEEPMAPPRIVDPEQVTRRRGAGASVALRSDPMRLRLAIVT